MLDSSIGMTKRQIPWVLIFLGEVEIILKGSLPPPRKTGIC